MAEASASSNFIYFRLARRNHFKPKTSRHSCGNRSYLEYCITYNLQRGEIESTILSISVERHNFSNSKKNLKADLSNHFNFEFLCFRVTALCFECLSNHWKEKFIITTLEQSFHRYLL
ncbi:hypothetical protein Avbf_05136 [Armadillidium vulgare]|nr:hypothetical protein Avbf_05136 [Armadillidium vulgare]